jgi:hypothetical protein
VITDLSGGSRRRDRVVSNALIQTARPQNAAS